MPFGHKVGAFTCFEIYICIGYVLPTIVGCCSFGGCTFVLDIFCQWVSVCPSGTGVGECPILEYVSVEYICWYWIYHANNWGMNLIQWVSVDYGTMRTKDVEDKTLRTRL